MHESKHIRHHARVQAWRDLDVAGAGVAHAGPVSTVRVKLVGTASEAAASDRPRFDTTQSYGRVLPSYEDCIALDRCDEAAREEFEDITNLVDHHDAFQHALAYARTIPAMTPQELGLSGTGVPEPERLQLWLEPRDSLSAVEQAPRLRGPKTLRVAAARHPLSRAWHVWEQLPASIAIGTAATFCLLSALAVSLFGP